jgi:hypothetical protein
MLVLIASPNSPLRRRLSAFVTVWQRLIEQTIDPYRPELHYMRGPGPKWLAKQQREYNLL